MKNALIGLLLICWFPRSGLASSCKPAASSIRGKVLRNHIIKPGSAERVDDCFKQCMGHSGCHSVNFYLEERLCELNDQTHASQREDMREEPLGNYMVNDFRPMTCNKHSDCENDLVCLSTMTCGECKDRALGMENNDIPNSAITASSTHGTSQHEPWRARLNNVVTGSSTGSWSAASNNEDQWLQIDLGKEMVVTKIATQGRPPGVYLQWVKSYKILFSSDGTNWEEFKENGSVKVFSGNSDSETIVPNVLSSRILARFMRFSILSWNNHISMRVELYGCP